MLQAQGHRAWSLYGLVPCPPTGSSNCQWSTGTGHGVAFCLVWCPCPSNWCNFNRLQAQGHGAGVLSCLRLVMDFSRCVLYVTILNHPPHRKNAA
ncbi:hypothetical protein AVEN_93888-1 [Araneus ventricosus]|uniref:Uncharacterized protein n=1 Tax=Araneus ventricosus TaxID=182803 RepID=A0A4Y2AZ61_ARAVE|nr:hypothetical protein AVEN_93888-1 [Araneus ventricosus]